VRNLRASPAVAVRVGRDGVVRPATARVVDEGTDEDARGRRLLLEKYQSPGSRDLEGWGRSALVVAVDLDQGLAPGTTRDISM
jgi:hypothetical protein